MSKKKHKKSSSSSKSADKQRHKSTSPNSKSEKKSSKKSSKSSKKSSVSAPTTEASEKLQVSSVEVTTKKDKQVVSGLQYEEEGIDYEYEEKKINLDQLPVPDEINLLNLLKPNNTSSSNSEANLSLSHTANSNTETNTNTSNTATPKTTVSQVTVETAPLPVPPPTNLPQKTTSIKSFSIKKVSSSRAALVTASSLPIPSLVAAKVKTITTSSLLVNTESSLEAVTSNFSEVTSAQTMSTIATPATLASDLEPVKPIAATSQNHSSRHHHHSPNADGTVNNNRSKSSRSPRSRSKSRSNRHRKRRNSSTSPKQARRTSRSSRRRRSRTRSDAEKSTTIYPATKSSSSAKASAKRSRRSPSPIPRKSTQNSTKSSTSSKTTTTTSVITSKQQTMNNEINEINTQLISAEIVVVQPTASVSVTESAAALNGPLAASKPDQFSDQPKMSSSNSLNRSLSSNNNINNNNYTSSRSHHHSGSKHYGVNVNSQSQPSQSLSHSSRVSSHRRRRSHHRKRRRYSVSRNSRRLRRPTRTYSRSRSRSHHTSLSRSPNHYNSSRSSSRSYSSYSSYSTAHSSYSSPRSRKYSVSRVVDSNFATPSTTVNANYDESGRNLSNPNLQQTNSQFSNTSRYQHNSNSNHNYHHHHHHSSSSIHQSSNRFYSMQSQSQSNNFNRSSSYHNSHVSRFYRNSSSGQLDGANTSATNSLNEEFSSHQANLPDSTSSIFGPPGHRRPHSLRQIKMENINDSTNQDSNYYRHNPAFRSRIQNNIYPNRRNYFNNQFNSSNIPSSSSGDMFSQANTIASSHSSLNFQQQQILAQINSEPMVPLKDKTIMEEEDDEIEDEEADPDYLLSSDSESTVSIDSNELNQNSERWQALNEFSLNRDNKNDMTLFDIVFKNKLASLCSDLNDERDAKCDTESLQLTEHILKLINLNNCDQDLNWFNFFDSSHTENKTNSLIYFILSNCLLSKSFSKIKLNRLFNSNCDENGITSRATFLSRDLARRTKRLLIAQEEKEESHNQTVDSSLISESENESVLNECLNLLNDENLI